MKEVPIIELISPDKKVVTLSENILIPNFFIKDPRNVELNDFSILVTFVCYKSIASKVAYLCLGFGPSTNLLSSLIYLLSIMYFKICTEL